MVDINLFKDDDEDEKKWDSSPGKSEGLGDDFKDDFDLGGGLTDGPHLEDDSLLGDIDAIPDLEESMENGKEENYEIGDDVRKKTSPVLWIVLGIVLIAAFFYWFVYQPAEKKKLKIPNLVMSRNRQIPAGQTQDSTQLGERSLTQKPPQNIPSSTVTEVMNGDLPKEIVPIPTSIEATKAAFYDLIHSEQFAAVLIYGNRFMVEYVSETPGIANSMGHRIQTLLGSAGYKVSPEERHRTAGKIYYWGVVSGVLPQPAKIISQVAIKQFSSKDAFITEIRSISTQHKVVIQEVDKMASSIEKNKNQFLVKMTIAGSRGNIFAFLDALKGMQGSFVLTKLLLVPELYSDFKAEKVKIVIDLLVSVQ
jgi:hypothetical protein